MRLRSLIASVLIVVAVTAAIWGTTCTRFENSAVGGSLSHLIVQPDELPADCELTMTYPPSALSNETEEDRSYFTAVAGFWSGQERSFALGQAIGGLSTTYTIKGVDNAIVVFAIRFKDSVPAADATQLLKVRYGRQANYWIREFDNLVIVISASPKVPGECASGLVGRVEKRAVHG